MTSSPITRCRHPTRTCCSPREATPLSVEVIVRGYITGVTDTALWTRYAAGERLIYGHEFPDGLGKNTPLPAPIITPTTKGEAGSHDEPLSSADVVEQGFVEAGLWAAVEAAALAMFERGLRTWDRGRPHPRRHEVRVRRRRRR